MNDPDITNKDNLWERRPVPNNTREENYHDIPLDAKCMDDRQQAFAITNLGQLIPCCWLDNQDNRKDLEYQQLLMVSHVSDYDTIEEILTTDEWIKFYNNLKSGKGFPTCHNVCKARSSAQHKREVFVNREDGEYIKET